MAEEKRTRKHINISQLQIKETLERFIPVFKWDEDYNIRGKNWVADDRRVELISIALILVAWDVGLEEYKKNVKSISARKEFIT